MKAWNKGIQVGQKKALTSLKVFYINLKKTFTTFVNQLLSISLCC
jgi:hypothetical protein